MTPNEEQATIALMDALSQSESEPQEAPKEEAKEPQQETPSVEAKEPVNNDLPDIKKMLEEHNQKLSAIQEQVNQKNQPQMSDEEKAQANEKAQAIAQLQNDLGIKAMQEQLQAKQEEEQRRAQFNSEVATFNKMHPDVNVDDIAQWAKDNNAEMFLGGGAKGWNIIYQAMQAQAKPTKAPDPITPSSSVSAEVSAFDRIKKGESPSMVDIGDALLNASKR